MATPRRTNFPFAKLAWPNLVKSCGGVIHRSASIPRASVPLMLMLTVAAAGPQWAYPRCTAEDSRPDPGRVRVQRDVVYGVTDSVTLKLDIALPIVTDPPTPRPCIVVIHGGGWRQGDKSHHRAEIQSLAAAGYVAASVGYRLAPAHRFPAQVHDVKQAVRFLRQNAEEYGIDRDRLGAMGFSAGGHLAMMLGTTGGSQDSGPIENRDGWATSIDRSSKVQAVVSYFGPTDFTRGNIPSAVTGLLTDFLGGGIAEIPDVYRDASPLTHLDSSDAPLLMFQGTRDPLVPYQQAVSMAEAMTRSNVDGRIELLVNASHGWRGQRRDHTRQVTAEFFELHLRKKH